MSTNFYLRSRATGTVEHVGKRSAGWAFTFQGQNFKTREEWERRLRAMGAQETVEDEYGREYTADEFLAEVDATLRPWGRDQREPLRKDGPFEMGGITFERDRRRNWVDGGCSFSNYEFS